MLQAVTILLIIGELSSKMQLMKSFWWFVLIALSLNIGMGLFVIFTGKQSYFDEESFLWVALSIAELIVQILTIALGLKLVSKDPLWNDPKTRPSFYQH